MNVAVHWFIKCEGERSHRIRELKEEIVGWYGYYYVDDVVDDDDSGRIGDCDCNDDDNVAEGRGGKNVNDGQDGQGWGINRSIGDVVSTLLCARTTMTGPKPGRHLCNNQPGNGTTVMALGAFAMAFFTMGDNDDKNYDDDDASSMTATPWR